VLSREAPANRGGSELTPLPESIPVVFPYQQALDEFRREGREPPLLKRMSELISLLDLMVTLDSGLSRREILDSALLIVMGELQISRGGLFVTTDSGSFRLEASRGLPATAPPILDLPEIVSGEPVLRGPAAAGLVPFGLEIVCPISKGERVLALLGLGGRANEQPFGPEEMGFLRSVAACAATPIENGLMYEELRRVNQRLAGKVFQLHGLFDISRELTASLEESAIMGLMGTTLMGQFTASRFALYLRSGLGLRLAHERGFRSGESGESVPWAEAEPMLEALKGPERVERLPPGLFKDRLIRHHLGLVVPLAAGRKIEGLAAVGDRASGAPFGDEDLDFAQTLARQALAALETVRLHQVRVEKERQDRELQVAREIQESLFPRECPRLPTLEIAAESHPCQQVGGDYYDFFPLDSQRWAVAIADVSGKGTPASILMASVHASLRALAGSGSPRTMIARLNRFLFESTQANKYATLFYGELDLESRRFAYVNAGHVPPYLQRAAGPTDRLTVGGPVLGLIEDAGYEQGEATLCRGDLLAMVTDGATEAMSPDDVEFGDERLAETVRACGHEPAPMALRQILEAARSWAGPAGCSDDLTALVLRAL
jgi:sigma-B regulation protein RsbU (phosphoserine phosphatase)